MIARGDLGIEVPAEKIPGIQRMLIRKCVEVKKPVIVATQMLHSMINNPRPTRAEVTDIANAIYYRTDALMLSGETAYGKYPIEAVQTMTKVAREAEKTKLSANDIRVPIEGNDLDVTSFLAKQAVKSSSKLHVKAIITDSYTGRTARYLAAFRGTSTVFAICYNPRVMRMLGLSYGVWAVHQPYNDSRRGYFYDALNQLIHSGRITRNDMVAYLSGSFGEGGGTSFLEINNVGKVLDAGTRRVLEIGTYTSYATLCMAEGMEEGALIHTIEINDEMEDFIMKYLSRSLHKDKIKVHFGDAMEIIPRLDETFDMVFIDADKRLYSEYYDLVFPMVRPGGLILADNTLWDGKVVEEVHPSDKQTKGILVFNEKVKQDDRVEKVILPLRDGLTMIWKK